MAAGKTAGARAFCRSRMGNRREQLEQGVVKQKTSWAIRKRSMGVLVVDVRVEVTGVRMAIGNMILTTEPQATGADAELVRMRMQRRTRSGRKSCVPADVRGRDSCWALEFWPGQTLA